MKELPKYMAEYMGYTRMKEAGTDGFPYVRHYTQAPKTTRERLLNYLRGRPWADNHQLSYVLHVSLSTVRYHLRKLQEEGVIVRYHSEGYRGDFWERIKE